MMHRIDPELNRDYNLLFQFYTDRVYNRCRGFA